MRLARTAAPPPRQACDFGSGRSCAQTPCAGPDMRGPGSRTPGSTEARQRGWDSNPRSRAHEAREDSRSSAAPGLRSLDASPSIPRTGDRRSRRATVRRGDVVHSVSSGAESQTMFSKPLALPFDPGSPTALQFRHGRRPTWRGLGARTSRAAIGNWQAKANAYCQRQFPARAAPKFFLSQAEPRFDLCFLKLSITSRLTSTAALETKKATRLGRPRLACYAARDLARTPPSEGGNGTGPAHPVEAVPVRLHRRGRRRFGGERGVVRGHRHHLGGSRSDGG